MKNDPGSVLHALAGALVILLAAVGLGRELAQHDWPLSLHQWIEALAWPAGGLLAAVFLPPLVRRLGRRR